MHAARQVKNKRGVSDGSQSTKRYLIKIQNVSTASFNPIFLPSSQLRGLNEIGTSKMRKLWSDLLWELFEGKKKVEMVKKDIIVAMAKHSGRNWA
jgi:hypothetical protein